MSYFRSYVNDIPNQPLITVTVTGAVDVACFTIEEVVPPGTEAVALSGDGVFLPTLNSVRWGPYLNISNVSVSYRLSASPGAYTVTGGSWMDGAWLFQTEETTVQVLSTSPLPELPPRLPSPVFMPPSGTDIPVNVSINMPGSVVTLLEDDWADADRTVHDPPEESAWFVSGSGTNLIATTNALTLWPIDAQAAVVGITYFVQHSNAPVSLNVGDELTATLNITFLTDTVGSTNGDDFRWGLQVGVFNFGDSALPQKWVSADGFDVNGQGEGVEGYALYQDLGTPGPADIRRRVNLQETNLFKSHTHYMELTGSTTSSNFPAFVPGHEYVLTLEFLRLSSSSLSVAATWLNTVTGGILTKTATDTGVTNFTFDGLPIRAASAENTATNIVLGHFQVDYLPKAADGFPDGSGADIYYTVDGTPPTLASTLYTGAVHVATPTTFRAAAFTNGWTPSPASTAYYGYLKTVTSALVQRSVDTNNPSAPVINFSITPSHTAKCLTLTESLPLGLTATNVTGGGNYVTGERAVHWGPFFGTNSQTLSYEAIGQPGAHPLRASWSVDGLGAGEAEDTQITIAGCTGIECLPPKPSPESPPVITVQPQPTNQTVLVGGTAQLSVTATSYFPMAYQWYFNEDNPIVSPPAFETLTLEDIRLEAAGSYLVVISNSFGSVTSDFAYINVLTPLVAGITVNPDGSVTLDLSGLPGSSTRTWATTNLQAPIPWEPISTNSVGPGGTWQVVDTNGTPFPKRFYRFSTP